MSGKTVFVMRRGDGGVVVAEAFYFCASFFVYFERPSHFITSNCVTELIFMCICIYMCVLYITHQYHVFVVYKNPITGIIVYIIRVYSMFYAFDAIKFYCTLSEMTKKKMINQSMCIKRLVYEYKYVKNNARSLCT